MYPIENNPPTLVKALKTRYHRYIPHIMPLGATFFVTTRLHGSISKKAIDQWKAEFQHMKQETEMKIRADPSNKYLTPTALNFKIRDAKYRINKLYFVHIDDYLHQTHLGPHHLSNPKIARIVKDKIHQYDGQYYDLLSYTIMSNHIHLLLDFSVQLDQIPSEEKVTEKNYMQLDKVMQLIKGGSSYRSNKVLGLRGSKFWEHGSYDHYARNSGEIKRIAKYILMNPVKAKLVKKWQDYAHSYCSPKLQLGKLLEL